MIGRYELGGGEQRLLAEVLDASWQQPRLRLADACSGGRGPGAYLLFVDAPSHPLYAATGGRVPVYVGSGKQLAARVARHRSTVRDIRDLDETEVRVCLIWTASYATALWVEETLRVVLRPLWSEPWLSGWGSRPPGARRHSRASAFDALHSGRAWVASTKGHDAAELVERAAAHLAAFDPMLRWP